MRISVQYAALDEAGLQRSVVAWAHASCFQNNLPQRPRTMGAFWDPADAEGFRRRLGESGGSDGHDDNGDDTGGGVREPRRPTSPAAGPGAHAEQDGPTTT